jgi:hypothetical protein
VYVTEAKVAGRRHSAEGPLDLGSDERTVEFGFTAPSFRAGETMRFQWRLLASSEEWSPPGTARSIVLAGLTPGRYRFEVRALDGEGVTSAPESVAFRIHPPFWQSGWFLGLASLALAGVVAVVYRARVARLIELERVRTRIATDLHDDVGASLSQIAVLSQFASRQATRGGDEVKGSLARITELSGSVVDAMSDVVWSINPARDRMSDLVHRMRRFAVDVFSETDVALALDLPADDADEPLSPEVRRQVFLVFKEALRNAARHAKASAVNVAFKRGLITEWYPHADVGFTGDELAMIGGRQLDLVLASRPDLAGALRRALEAAGDAGDPIAWVESLAVRDPSAHEALVTATVAGYYLHPTVQRRLGYPGQLGEVVRVDAYPDFISEGQLERVLERGPIYRPTPPR